MKRNADTLKAIMREAGLTRLQTAELLHVSIDTLHAWLKPETSKSSNPCPLWAVELLGFKSTPKVMDRVNEGLAQETARAEVIVEKIIRPKRPWLDKLRKTKLKHPT